MKNLILILTIVTSLFAQYEWSEPVTVSGLYWCTESAITVDNNGVLSALWCKNTDLTKSYYGAVYFSQSFNGGINWIPEVNITPDYNEYPVWEIRAVTDSENNIHIIYAQGLESKVVIYKKYDGISWTDDYTINFSLAANMRYGIDNSDRLFATWSLGSTSYYTYCDIHNDSIIWSEPARINHSIDYLVKGFIFNSTNDIYAICNKNLVSEYRPYHSFFDKNLDNWTIFEEIHDYQEKTLGCAIALSKKDSLYTNTAVGNSMIDNRDNQLQKDVIDSTWSNLVEIGSINNWWDRIMFVDSKNVVHLFEVNEENDIHSLNHTYGKGTTWQTETIHSDPDYYIPRFDVKRKIFEDYDEYYVLYRKSGTFSRINFQTKRVSTGIENNGQFTIDNLQLEQNYPNPFNNQTNIEYQIQSISEVEINIYNTKGEFVTNLVNEKQNKGKHSVNFNANKFNSGIYYYQLEVDGIVKETKKMLYLK